MGQISKEDKLLRYYNPKEYYKRYYIEEPNTGCWLWTGFIRPKGYGGIRLGLTNMTAHEGIWTLYKGDVPKGMSLDHLCKVKSCVNPDHLEIVSLTENNRRKISNGLTMILAREIREKYASGISSSELAFLYKISQPTICDVVAYRSWKE